MPYTKRIVCLANSFKTGGFCVAGREITSYGFGPWIRPVSDRPKAELSLLESTCGNGLPPKLLDIIDVTLLGARPHGHQRENHLNDPSARWIKRGRLPFAELAFLAEEATTLWTNSGHTSTGAFNCISPAEAARHTSSLMLLRSTSFSLVTAEKGDGNLSYRGHLRHGPTLYKLNVTDPCVARRFSHLPADTYWLEDHEEIFLTLSLTEPYDRDQRCHKLVAAVITNPPL